MHIFNEKTVAVLELIDKNDTAVFVSAVTQLWNCLNIKTKDCLVLLNGKNREPFSSIDDTRFEKMLNLPEQFFGEHLSGRVMFLTSDSNDLQQCLKRNFK